MNEPLDFEQDPEAPAGTGTFRFQDGSELYAMEPDLAARLKSRLEATAPPKLAQNDPRAALVSELQGMGMPKADPLAAINDAPGAPARPPAAAPPSWAAAMPGDDGLPAKFQMAPPAPAHPPEAAPAGTVPAAPEPRQAPALPPRPLVHFAGRDPAREAATAVPVPTKSSTTIERQGAPYSLEMAGLREVANQGVVQAKLAEAQAQQQRFTQEAAATAATLPALQQQAHEQKAAYEKLQANYRAERDRLRQEIARYDAEAKPDPGRFFKSGFGAPAIGMIIGQALGAYAATLRGGDNFAQRMVQDAWEKDLQAQREEIQLGRVGHDNKLAALADQLGDVQQAESAWKILQSEVLDREVRAFSAAAKSQEVEQAANTWLAQNAQERLREEQRFMDLSLGKATTTTSADMVVPRRGGSRPMTDDELIALQTRRNKAKAGLLESENELQFQGRGGKHAPPPADASLYVEGYGQAKTKEEAVALRREVAEFQARERELDRTAELNRNPWAAVGVELPFVGPVGSKEYTEAHQLAERSVTTTARSYGGPITQSDRDSARPVTPDARKIVGNQDVKIESARRANRELLNERIRAIVSGNHPELPETRRAGEEE